MRKDFALCFNDGYVPYASVTIKSILAHMHATDDVCIHVVSDYISEPNLLRLRQLVGETRLKVYIVKDTSMFEGLVTLAWNVFIWYRCLLPRLVDENIHKVLYLDCDTIVNDSLDELFSIDMGTKAVAGCIDTQTYNESTFQSVGYDSELNYICSGVLMMNLDKWRNANLVAKIIEYAVEKKDIIRFPDQDAINYVCREDKIILPAKYGVLVSYFTKKEFIKEHMAELEGLMRKPAIVHYAGYSPWIYVKDKSVHSHLWWGIYESLHSFSSVRRKYYWTFVRYVVWKMLCDIRLIKQGNRLYYYSQYFAHPRLKEADIMKLIKE